MNDGGHDDPRLTPPLSRASLDLPVPAITRRRLAVLVAGFVAIWLVGVFARQVGDASTAAANADALRARNAAVASQVASLQREVELSQQAAYVELTGHAYGLGGPNEMPFVVDPKAPALASDAPGSVGIRATRSEPPLSPLDTWLRLLFGPGND